MRSKTILVKKRFGEETLSVQEFIRPNTYMVAEWADAIWSQSAGVKDYIHRLHRSVLYDIHSPTASPARQDWHGMRAYFDHGSDTPLISLQANDFWAYPSETLTNKVGDCDDKCILLVSGLRRRMKNAWCTVGTYQGIGHMWVLVGNHTLLETMSQYRSMGREQPPYEPMFRFNDLGVTVLKRLQNTPLERR